MCSSDLVGQRDHRRTLWRAGGHGRHSPHHRRSRHRRILGRPVGASSRRCIHRDANTPLSGRTTRCGQISAGDDRRNQYGIATHRRTRRFHSGRAGLRAVPRWRLSSSRTRVPNRPLNGATEQPNWFTVQVRLSRCERAVEYVALANLAVTICFLGAQALLLGAYLVNGDEGISDNWVGFLAVAALFTALAMSLVALGVSI